ncbi:hypothetical protein ACFL09_04855 [Planctomycetota bacterium]
MAREPMDKKARRAWARAQIEQFGQVRPRYKRLADTLKAVFEQAKKKRAPLAIVQARAKVVGSFAEKIHRKPLPDPINEFTDLCGARVIVHTQDEIQPICSFIEEHFEIDWENTIDVSQRLSPSQFGYRSIHYIVAARRDVFPTGEIDVAVPEDVFPDDGCLMRAEIQVRTVLEHAWAVFSHDMSYKSEFAIPAAWERELAVLAALLEEADRAFIRVKSGLEAYEASYGAYMTEEQIRDEIDTLELVLSYDPRNEVLAHRIGKLAITLGDWQKAVDVLSGHTTSGCQPLLRDLGVALCKLHKGEPDHPGYRRGQQCLESATKPPSRDADALASLAGTWRGVDDAKAKELYRQAYDLDPSDPYPLGNYLGYLIAERGDLWSVALMRPAIRDAVRRCRGQGDVGMNLPWAFYDMAKFSLLLGEPYESLSACAKAVQLSAHAWMIETTLRSFEELGVVSGELPSYECLRRFLLVACAARPGAAEAMGQVKAMAGGPIDGPVAIVTGGCAEGVEAQMQAYRSLLVDGFAGFGGTILSGGTKAGIAALVGDVQEAHGDAVRTIGYVPKALPDGVELDDRYTEHRHTEGEDFGPLEPIQSWIDILASGIDPATVTLVGIDGGRIAAAEYRMALSLGARVAVIDGSGREAGKLRGDEDWNQATRLQFLPPDPAALRSWIAAAAGG